MGSCSTCILKILFGVIKRLVNCWPFNLDALDILILSKVNNLLLNFVQLLVKETETLHYPRGL